MSEPAEARLDEPIFVAGVAGSGKTPLTRLLNRHPNIAIVRRTYMWRDIFDSFGDLRESDNLDRCLAAMAARPGIQALDPDLDRIRREFASGPPSYGHLFALFHRHHAAARGKPRWGEQLGLAEARAPAILSAYPSAKMIQMIRDPRRERLAAGRPGRNGWSLGKWVTSAELAMAHQRSYPDRYLVVKFEDLAADPRQTLDTVLEFLDEPLVKEPAPVDPEEFPAFGNGAATEGEVDAAAVRFVERHAADGLDRFGYEIPPAASSPGIRYTLLQWPADRAGLGAWNVLRRRRIRKEVGW